MRRLRHWRGEQLSATRGPRPGAPEAPAGFVSELADHVRETRRDERGLTRATSYAVRLALAVALTLVMLGAFMGFGGIGYAAGGVADKVKVVKGKVWTEKAGSANTIGTADDDDDGGGGGGGDDDDDGGGGGGGDDDDDGDDDEYEEEEEECDEGVQQQRRAENRLHSDNMRAINRMQPKSSRKQAKEAEQNRHRTEVRRLQQAQGECDDIGGGDDDDDDDD